MTNFPVPHDKKTSAQHLVATAMFYSGDDVLRLPAFNLSPKYLLLVCDDVEIITYADDIVISTHKNVITVVTYNDKSFCLA